MAARSTQDRYGAVAQALHMVSLVLILVLIPLGMVMANIGDGGTRTALFRSHVAIGLVVFALTLGRVVWRLVEPTPAVPTGIEGRRRALYRGVHIASYVVLLALSVTGLSMLLGSGMSPLPGDVVPSELDTALPAVTAHFVLALILVALLVLHVGAIAIYQRRKGDVLGRMGLNRTRPGPVMARSDSGR